MGVQYELYDFTTKQFIGLGKRRFKRGGYQMPADRIKAFCRGRKNLRMFLDCERLPTDADEGWRCVGRWHWEEEDYALFEQGLMSSDGFDRMERVGGTLQPLPSD